MKKSVYLRIYATIKQIPEGRVATYGQIARMTHPATARMVGYALHALPDDADVPWQRVINSRGEISLRSGNDGHLLQRKLLENEGIIFDSKGRIDLKLFGWRND